MERDMRMEEMREIKNIKIQFAYVQIPHDELFITYSKHIIIKIRFNKIKLAKGMLFQGELVLRGFQTEETIGRKIQKLNYVLKMLDCQNSKVFVLLEPVIQSRKESENQETYMP